MNDRLDSNECLQVVIRCRPLMQSEMQLPVPVEVHAEVNKIIVRDVGCNKNSVKAFSFDKVFGPEATQDKVYNNVGAPLIQEVLMGFNCTILAYGQTGTGKTFTIEGDRNATLNNPLKHTTAGIIPRSMEHIFEELNKQNCDFEVSVSFLELYNEEIYDLLSKAEDLTKLKLYDGTKGSVNVQGLEIRNVTSMQDVNDVLNKGCKKRRKAATLLNSMSSRSHTLFTVSVKMKERSTTIEKIKTGKLNLVDLAGSENIGRSGAVDKRAREAGNINQSLLALGRVITALCENAIHVPYRESKLTRLLRDSLGGQTKTTVIATISPSIFHLDETSNTLEYALRAKNILNKPEVNAQVSATALTKDYLGKIYLLEMQIMEEIEKKGNFQVDPDNVRYLEAAIATKSREMREEYERKENLMAESDELDILIQTAREELHLKKLELKKCESDQVEIAERLVKEQEEIRSVERELLILDPAMSKLHETHHQVLKEKETISDEVKKMEETAAEVVNENSRLEKRYSNMCSALGKYNEVLVQFKNELMNSINEVQKAILGEKSECEKHLLSMDSGFGSFFESSDKLCQQFVNLQNDVEKLKSNFQDSLSDALRNEEIQAQERQLEIESSISSLAPCNLDLLQPLLARCEENLQNIFQSLGYWNDALVNKLTYDESLLNNYLSVEDKYLWSLKDSCKVVTQTQKEFIQEYGEVISAAFSEENERKVKFDEKMSALEEALEQMHSFLIENLDNEVDKRISVHDKFREHAEGEMRNAESLLIFCESSMESTELFTGGMEISSSRILDDNMKDMRESANKAILDYQNLLPDFSNCIQQKKVSDERIKELEQRVSEDKSRRLEMPNISSSIQSLKENLVMKDKCSKTLDSDHQAELKTIETNQDKAMKQLHESFNRLHDTVVQGLSQNISAIETSESCNFSWKENSLKDDDDPNTTLVSSRERSNSGRISTLDVTFTFQQDNKDENDGGCKFCTYNDETFSAPSTSLSVPVAKPNKSKVSRVSKQNKSKKKVLQSDMAEKWIQELFSDCTDKTSHESEKSDPVD